MKTIYVSAKCSDLCNMTLNCERLGMMGQHDGYVPKWFPNPHMEHYGDYVILEIDIDTGHILNWKKPTESDLKETFGKKTK